MLHANKADSEKVEALVRECLIKGKGKKAIFASLNLLYEHGKFSNIRKRNFAEEVADCLCGSDLIKEFGSWVFTEYGDGQMVFAFLGYTKPNSEASENNNGDGGLIKQLVDEHVAVDLNKILRRSI